jgi:hypothetical protein
MPLVSRVFAEKPPEVWTTLSELLILRRPDGMHYALVGNGDLSGVTP